MISLLLAGALTAQAPPSVRADGRSTAEIVLDGGPAPLEGESPDLVDEGSISCQDAAVIAPGIGKLARVLPPASTEPRELVCRARRRGEEAAFSLRVEPPSAGLYASLSPDLSFQAFRIPGAAPRSLRVAASAGVIEGDPPSLALPPGRAPRAIAVALLDDEGAGAAFLPLPGRTQLHLESKRRAMLSVRVAGETFGPVRAPEGKATLPVSVPPGVRQGVVRAVDRLGNARELPVDLDTPDLPRIAAVISAEQVVAGGDLRIAIALAAADGAPAQGAELRAVADRGALPSPEASGPGLYLARYKAPALPGADRIAIDVPADPAAGHAEFSLEVIPGPPAVVALELPQDALHVGEELTARARVRDASGNALSGVPLQASLSGSSARVSWDGAAASLAVRAPEKVPAGALELSVQAGGTARAAARIAVLPAEASAAELRAETSQRSGNVHVLVRDRFDNALGVSGYAVAAQGAAVGPLHPSAGGAAEADLEADPRARSAETSVVAGGRVLARARVDFQPPPGAWLAVAWTDAGAMSNGGALRAPRIGAGIGLRRQFGRVEGALLFGLDTLWYRSHTTADLGGAPRTVSQRLFALSLPVLLRARLPFARRWGFSLEAGAVPTFARTSASTDVSGPDRITSLVAGLRGRAVLDFTLGRSRLLLGASWGRARLRQGPLQGEIEGRSIFVGYEAWWLDLGP
jgi:hypothetical protein